MRFTGLQRRFFLNSPASAPSNSVLLENRVISKHCVPVSTLVPRETV